MVGHGAVDGRQEGVFGQKVPPKGEDGGAVAVALPSYLVGAQDPGHFVRQPARRGDGLAEVDHPQPKRATGAVSVVDCACEGGGGLHTSKQNTHSEHTDTHPHLPTHTHTHTHARVVRTK